MRLTGRPQFYRCEPHWRWAPPPLPDYDLWCVLEGDGEMHLGGRTHPLAPGVCFVVWPGAIPRATHHPQRRLHVFACHFEFAGEVPPPPQRAAESLPTPDHALRDTSLLLTLARGAAAAARRGDGLGAARARLYVQQILLHLWEESRAPVSAPSGDAPFLEIAAAIREDPGGDWSVKEQARRACLSRAQYTRRFVRALGVPPNRFVVETRLERAAHLLRETDMTVSQIADALGYRDLYFFSRQFKQHRGVPPGSLRKEP